MNNAKLPEGFDAFLAETYETLKQHEQRLFDLTVDLKTAVGILKQHPLFADQFDGVRSQVLQELTDAHNLNMRFFDVTIARLRST